MLTLFVVPVIPSGELLHVEGEEAHHGIKSLRLNVGEVVKATDGKGAWVAGPVREIGKKSFEIAITSRGQESIQSPKLIVIQALTKSDRMKETLDLLTVGGADEIIPWQSERSIGKWQSDSRAKWEEVVHASSKQSRRVNFPLVREAISTDEIRENFKNVYVLHEAATTSVTDISFVGDEITMVVGPEGGISDSELSKIGGREIRLGKEVLRSAHAGFAALASIQTLIKRW